MQGAQNLPLETNRPIRLTDGGPAPGLPAQTTYHTVDRWRSNISSAIADSVARIDRFFGDERLDDENRRTHLRVGLGLQYDGEDGTAVVSDFRLRLALPCLERRLHLLLDEARSTEGLDDALSILDTPEDPETGVGLRYIFSHAEQRRISADVGARLRSPFQVFGRLRGRLTVPCADGMLRLTQSVAWFTEDGWTETSEMTWNRRLAGRTLFRTVSRLTWEESSGGVTPEQAFVLLRQPSPRRAYSLALSGIWPETPRVESARYAATLTYRRQIHRPWLFLEIAPGVGFPQENGYACNPFVAVKCEVLFDKE